MKAWDRIGFESSMGFECNECSAGTFSNGDPMHSVYYSDLGLPTPLVCFYCDEEIEHKELP